MNKAFKFAYCLLPALKLRQVSLPLLLPLFCSATTWPASRSLGAGWHDTCYISNIHVTPDVKSKDVIGVKIDFDTYLIYDAKHKGTEPKDITFEVHLLNAAGKKLPAAEKHSCFYYEGNVRAIKTDIFTTPRKKETRHFFIPYYCLELPAGTANLKYSLVVSLRDTSIMENYRSIALKGADVQPFQINKPPVLKMKMLCTGVRVTAKDHGHNWDFGLYGLPDPIFKVIMDNEVDPDILYTSVEVQNSLSAAWLDPSPPVLFSEGDKITLGIYDKDTLIDDLIGKEAHTIDEWIELTKTAKEMAFDQVLYCTVKVEKLK